MSGTFVPVTSDRFVLSCPACGHPIFAKRIGTAQDALADHVAYAHPTVHMTIDANPVDGPKGTPQ